MSSGGYYNGPVVDWARQNISGRVQVRPLFSSRAGVIFTYGLTFCVPAAFFALSLVAFALGVRDPYVVKGPLLIGLLMLIPCGVIALLGAYVRRGLAQSLDAEGVSGSFGQRFLWGKLYHVDHVTKHFRAGGTGRQVKDNQLELVFEDGKVIIPPLIHDRASLWALVNGIPTEVRNDGVTRAPASGGNPIRTYEELMAFLQSPDGPRSQGE